MDTIIWMCVTRHAQSTQNMKITYLCHISENDGGWSWFLPCRYASKVSWNWYYHFRFMWSGMPILPKITSLLFFYSILRKKWMMKLIFCMQISMKVWYKWIVLFWWGMVKHSRSPQNSKFSMPLQYFNKGVWGEVDCLHANKHQSFLQVNFNIMGIKVSY